MDISYQLRIVVHHLVSIDVGRLGRFEFAAGVYLYTGSARRNLAARLARHHATAKRPHWHIDYLLTATGVEIRSAQTFPVPECVLNHATPGEVVVPRFGASDCRVGCGSHLKYLGAADWP